MPGAFVRRAGFWVLDCLRGGKVYRNYKDVSKRMACGELNHEQLNVILNHAVKTTEFYKNCDVNDFNSFPVISKNDIKTNWDKLYSCEYKAKPIHHMSTSGSTGTPFVMDWDMDKRNRQLAELIYFNKLACQKLGQKYVYFRVWTDKNRKSKKELWMQNLVPINILYLNNENLEAIRQRLKKPPYINSLLGYASTYEHIAKYLKSQGDTPDMFRIKSIVSGSEVLSMQSKELLKETLGCKVIDRYSNEENGFLAQSGDMSDDFTVNTASFKIEILRMDSDEPVDLGETGRIVVTDLFSRAVPLIRYDTGDLAVKAAEKNGWTTMLKTIQGRRVDCIYDTKGNKLTSHTWGVYMWKYPKLLQYQFVQEGARQYTLKVNGARENYTDDELISHMKEILGQDADITIEHVEVLPSLASGKFKKTVCNYVYNENDYN